MSLEFALDNNLDPFDEEALEKFIWQEEEKTESTQNTNEFKEPQIVMETKKMSGNAGIKIMGEPGKEMHATAMAKNKVVSYAQNKVMQANVMFAEVINDLDATGEEIYLGSTILDDNGRGVIIPEKELADGDYYLIIGDGKKVSDISTLTISKGKAPKTPEIKLIGIEKGLYPFVAYVFETIEKLTSLNTESFIAEAQGSLTLEDKTLIIGKADPGTTIIAMYKSHIITSALISDASQGDFELTLLEELEEGDHTVLVYAYDKKNNIISNITALLFKK